MSTARRPFPGRNKISVRADGVAIAAEVEDPETNSIQARNSDRLVVLIHGYENAEADAAASYGDFITGMRELGMLEALGAIWEFHWPGDHPVATVSKLTFSGKVPVAIGAGELLARWWLSERQPNQKVVIVAHSLGCRAALQVVKWIRGEDELGARRNPPAQYRGATLEAVFLLAAAVPVHICADGPLDAPWRECKEYAFHSTNDKILKRFFGPGAWVAGERGPAVGLEGAPVDRWSLPLRNSKLGHSEYWGSDEVAAKICELLRLTPPGRPSERWLPAEDHRHVSQDLAQRSLDRRQL